MTALAEQLLLCTQLRHKDAYLTGGERLIPAAAWPTKSCSCHVQKEKKRVYKYTDHWHRIYAETQNGELIQSFPKEVQRPAHS